MFSSNACCCRCSCGKSKDIQPLNFPCTKRPCSLAKSKTAPKSHAIAIQNLCTGSDAPMSSNSHSQAPDVKLYGALQLLGLEEAKLRLLAQRHNSRFTCSLWPDLKTFTRDIQSFPPDNQLQQIDCQIRYIQELRQEVEPPLTSQNSKDSSPHSRNKSRGGEPTTTKKNYKHLPETHPSYFGAPLCDISKALQSIQDLPATANKKALMTFALRMLAHQPKLKEKQVQERYQLLHLDAPCCYSRNGSSIGVH